MAAHAPDLEVRLALTDRRYWRRNVWLTMTLLLVWAVAGLGCGILFADAVEGPWLGGFPFGFWFAQQGSILVFVLLILVYAVGMALLDRAHRRERRALRDGAQEAAR